MTKDELWLLTEKYGGALSPAYEADRARLASGEPLAYVIGWQPFLGLKIYLDSHPLIPRPETEWWVDALLREPSRGVPEKRVPQRVGARGGDFSAEKDAALLEGTLDEAPLKFLDLCAGSGAIGCAALKLTDADIYFGEIDPAHQATIEKNVRENDLDASRAHIKIGDLFEPFGDMRFDIIACNPPYIPTERVLEKSVADYEPALALRSGNDGLDLIRRIATELRQHLTPAGVAWIECDSAHAAAPTPRGGGAPITSVGAACALFTSAGFSATIRTDQYKVPRVIVVSFS
ncbi:MAG: HemK/PrmC family methyltransferase [Patescibacteria group bacterium]